MITIQGLTKQQRQIADMIWSCDTQEDVDRLIQNLPKSYNKDAVVIHQMMIAAVMDQHEGITEDVQSVIDRVRYS
jgi:23S rRNA C2498 (ribose-2'-O)-methylase RlmM